MLVAGGVALAGVVWYSFLRDRTPEELLQRNDLTTSTSAIDSDVVAILLQLRADTLSGTIFTDPVFMSLMDHGQEIKQEPVGRPNPFAPLEGSASVGDSGELHKYLVDEPSKPMQLGSKILGFTLIAFGLILLALIATGFVGRLM